MCSVSVWTTGGLMLLQAIELPTATYPLSESIPHDVITSCQLSSLQLEGILYAVSLCHSIVITVFEPDAEAWFF